MSMMKCVNEKFKHHKDVEGLDLETAQGRKKQMIKGKLETIKGVAYPSGTPELILVFVGFVLLQL